MIYAILYSGKKIELTPKIEKSGDTVTVTVLKEIDYREIEFIDFEFIENIASAGNGGYMIIPNEGMLCGFKEMPDTEYISDRFAMPVFGVKTDRECFAAIVTGMAYNYKLISGVKNGRYYIYPRFLINGEELYENISVAYHYLSGEDADYSGMARCYRNYQLKRGECLPLAERAAARPELEYAKDSVMIRIRQGWKPCAPEVLEQTPETEPPMYSACNFDRVSEIVDELKRQGIDKAEICLVGWNTKGHDGRWPQCFPVSGELGGEQKLRALIKKARDMGYQITCHTNSTDTYRISELWNEDDLITDSDGSYPKDAPWSGGQMYQICPEIALKQAKEILPQVAGLGFHGIHYIDVLNIVMPRTCHNKKHPLNMGESIKKNKEIMKLAQELFGGYSSEGGYDFGAKYLDFALNLNYYGDTCPNPMCDEKIPFWQLVYHGIILSNPDMCECMNFSCRKESAHARLKLIEYGGRPTFYYYSVFRDNWRDSRDEDLICDDRAQLEKSVAQIKEGYELNKLLAPLQTAFMDKHEKTADSVYKVTYSNGAVVEVDYNKKTFSITKG